MNVNCQGFVIALLLQYISVVISSLPNYKLQFASILSVSQESTTTRTSTHHARNRRHSAHRQHPRRSFGGIRNCDFEGLERLVDMVEGTTPEEYKGVERE